MVHETIDGETILIHLGTGKYYSLDGAASEVWQWLAAGVTGDALVEMAIARYEADPREVEAGVDRLVEEMYDEGLVVENGSSTESKGSPTPTSPTPIGETVPFAMPALQVYTDMQEFMLVDPLHEVDEVAGWPHAKPG